MTLVRDGLQSGAWQWALVNTIPRAARRSRCGVLTCGCPARHPTQSFRSSMAMKRTLGRVAASVAGEPASRTANTNTRVMASLRGQEVLRCHPLRAALRPPGHRAIARPQPEAVTAGRKNVQLRRHARLSERLVRDDAVFGPHPVVAGVDEEGGRCLLRHADVRGQLALLLEI